jgi:MT-A70
MNCLRPIKPYGVIYADPPWNFKNFSEKGTGRNAVAHYKCMDFVQLAAVQPQRWAAKDCVLFLWATDPMLPKALELIDGVDGIAGETNQRYSTPEPCAPAIVHPTWRRWRASKGCEPAVWCLAQELGITSAVQHFR